MVSLLRAAVNAGELHRVTRSGEVDGVLDGLMQHEWVVYTRHCLNQAESVVDYLARYTHRIAISNGRLLTMKDDRIAFRYKDYRDHSRLKTQWLDGQEFVRRFLMHILPKGFMRIRHFGYLSNCTRRRKLAVIRHCLSQPPKPSPTLGFIQVLPTKSRVELEIWELPLAAGTSPNTASGFHPLPFTLSCGCLSTAPMRRLP
jgi:hypothetical protein